MFIFHPFISFNIALLYMFITIFHSLYLFRFNSCIFHNSLSSFLFHSMVLLTK